jgi:hypothetical protein
MDSYDLSTVIGCAGATYATVAGIKQLLSGTRFGSGHWVLAMVALVSSAWTYLASQVFGTLAGDFSVLLLSVFASSLAAVGTHEGLIPLLVTVANAMNKRAGAILLLCGLLVVAGCDTSKPFQYGTNAIGPRLAKNADRYVAADAALTPAEKIERESKIAALKDATSDRDAITYDGVSGAWNPLRQFYLPYVEKDPTFRNAPNRLAAKLFPIAAMDRLLEAEKVRRAVMGIFGDKAVQKAATEAADAE